MPIPDFQTLMLPLLRVASDGKERSVSEVRVQLAEEFDLSEEDRSQLLPSGRQPVFSNRVAWAKVYLQQAGLLLSVRRGHFQISPRGMQVLQNPPERIDIRFLDQFPEFIEFRTPREKSQDDSSAAVVEDQEPETPEETLEESYRKIRSGLISELLAKIKDGTPQFFEKLVVELLIKMGYGGSRREAGQTIGRSGDEGIDGIISKIV